jgi:hypothetical protein
MLRLTGRVRASLDGAETAYRLAPLALPTIMWRAMTHSLIGRDEAALREAALGRSLGATPDSGGGLPFLLASAAGRQGRYADAAAPLVLSLPEEARAAGGAAAIASAYEAAANPAKRPAALAALQHLASTVPFGDMEQRRGSLLLWLHTLAGDLDGAYAAGNRALDEAARSGSIGSSWFVVWFPSMRPFRQDQRFQAFVVRLNLVEYWSVYVPAGRLRAARSQDHLLVIPPRSNERLSVDATVACGQGNRVARQCPCDDCELLFVEALKSTACALHRLRGV